MTLKQDLKRKKDRFGGKSVKYPLSFFPPIFCSRKPWQRGRIN